MMHPGSLETFFRAPRRDEQAPSHGRHPKSIIGLDAASPAEWDPEYPAEPLGAITGRRIEGIVLNGSLQRSSHARNVLLSTAGAAALALPAAVGLLTGLGGAPVLRAHSTRQKFEVASVHSCGPNAVAPLREGGGLGDIGPSPNRVSRNCVTVLSLIQDAYVIFADGQKRSPSSLQMPPIEKAPAWISSDLYTIEAVAEGTPGQPAMLGPMMQSLLEDRFHLKLHRETRSGPAFALTVAKHGSRLKVNDGTCSVDVPSSAVPRDPASGRPVPGLPAAAFLRPANRECPAVLGST
jgi:hypothetical protein